MGDKEYKNFYHGNAELGETDYFQLGEERVPAYYFAGLTNLAISDMMQELEQDRKFPTEEQVYLHDEWDERIKLTAAAVSISRFGIESPFIANGLPIPEDIVNEIPKALTGLAAMLLFDFTEKADQLRAQWTDKLRFIPKYIQAVELYPQGTFPNASSETSLLQDE